jgi:hypothetical protein
MPTPPHTGDHQQQAAEPAAPGAESHPTHPLTGLLSCVSCQQFLHPVDTARGRVYRRGCGCHPDPVDATLVERLIRDAIDAHEPSVIATTTGTPLADVFQKSLAQVSIGSSTADLEITFAT